ncbi:uncharacterized protein K452DRAFT_233550, partial [Aplosporella prunicola CBS 121167]
MVLCWASSVPKKFRYERLQEEYHIRLLEVEPYQEERDKIRCHLYEFSLKDRGLPPFDALSYSWNAPVMVEEEIECNQASNMITESLYEALLRRSKSGERRLLWTDGLCIDQTNLKEQGDQVARMGEIYSLASRVIVWLGEDPSNVEEML